MTKTHGLTHIHHAVRDLPRALAFYKTVFGMEERFWDGPSMVFLNTPGSKDTITLRQAPGDETVGPGGGIGHFGFRLADRAELDAAVEEIVAAGGKLLEQGQHASGDRYAYVADPDGYVIEL